MVDSYQRDLFFTSLFLPAGQSPAGRKREGYRECRW
jgi:hypothetical protein